MPGLRFNKLNSSHQLTTKDIVNQPPTWSWTDEPIVADTTKIKAIHVNEMRSRIKNDLVYCACTCDCTCTCTCQCQCTCTCTCTCNIIL